MTKDLPYLINNLKVAGNVILTVEPGVIIKFSIYGRLEIYGTLNASSSLEKIVFTSFYDDEYGGDTNNDGTSTSPYSSGYWDRIYFSPLGHNSSLKNVIIANGGVTPGWVDVLGEIVVSGTKVEFENLLMKNSSTYGLFIENSPETIIANSHFKNVPTAIKIIGGCPQLSGLTFELYSSTILPAVCSPP